MHPLAGVLRVKVTVRVTLTVGSIRYAPLAGILTVIVTVTLTVASIRSAPPCRGPDSNSDRNSDTDSRIHQICTPSGIIKSVGTRLGRACASRVGD